MTGEIHRLRDRPGDSEKITINVGFVDLGHIDLLVREGFYSNRTDFIRTAIRNQLASHADAVKQSIVRRTLELGLRRFSRDELEAVKARGGRLNIQVVGLAAIDDDVTPELALATIEFDHRAWRSSRQQGRQGGALRPHRLIDPASLFTNKDPTMNFDFSAAMREAARLTRAQKLMEATRVIQRALAGRGLVSGVDAPPETARPIALPPQASETETAAAVEPPQQRPPAANARAERATVEERLSGRTRRPLGEVLTLLRQADLPGFAPHASPAQKLRKAPTVPVPDGAAYLTRTFACAAGSRDYTLYVPSHTPGRARPLLVMLHGCTQNPDDFALGTGMNRLAEEHGFIVAYPRQPPSANPAACWNWFHRANQMRDKGEPGVIAGITRRIMAEFGIDEGHVYVAGLSAGGAMAAIMAATHPELYAAAGVHSGLAYGSAADLPSAFAAMRGAPAGPQPRKSRPKRANGRVRTIVFHGASDKTVNPSNAETILADARAGLPGPAHETQHDGVAGGRAYTQTVIADANGVPLAEHWSIQGLGHAWSGGSPEGSFTDRHGPDASREMLRFFLATPTG